MNKETIQEAVINLEHQLWNAFASGGSDAFGRLEAPEALFVVGGMRTSGA